MVRDYVFTILFILGLIIPGHSYGQSQADSLKKELQTARGLQRAELLIELGIYTRQRDVREAIEQANDALAISKRLGAPILEAKSLRRLGYFHSLIEKNTQALEYYLSALALEKKNGQRLEEAEVLHQLGRFYYGQEAYSKALDYFFRALRIREADGDKNGSANTLYYLGAIYNSRNEVQEAISFYQRSYDLGRKIDDYRQVSMSASEIGILLQEQDSLDQALTYYQKGLSAAERLNSSHAQATILLHMSSAYQDKKLFEEAVALNNKQMEIAKAEDSKFLEAQGLENLAELYQNQGNMERSNQYFLEAQSLYKSMEYLQSAVLITNKLAQNVLRQQQIARAIKYGREALKEAKEIGSLEEAKSALQTLIDAYTQQGNFEQAFRIQANLTAVNDSLFNKEQEKQIAEMQTRYETEQKEKEIALLEKEKEKAKLVRNAFIGGLLLIIVMGFLIYNRQRLKIKKNSTELENTRLKEEQLKQDLEFKNKQLTTHSLNLVQKNETMKELKENINKIKEKESSKIDRELQSLQNIVDYSFNLDEDWEEFRLYFEEVHTGFFDALKNQYPDLTSNELRLSALVKLNLTTKEIATIMGITPDSVKTARYRLRKKLDMKTEENLTDFMMDIEQDIKV